MIESVYPPGRYGRRRAHLDGTGRSRPRWLAPTLTVIAIAVLAAGATGVYALESQWKLSYQVTGFGSITDTGVTVRFDVVRPEHSRAVCLVRARNEAGAEVGRSTVPVPPSAERASSMTYRLVTKGRPVTGEVEGCRPAS